MNNEIHIALTGHRPTKLGGYNLERPGYKKLQAHLEQYIRFQLQNHDFVVCHSGLALGADSIWSKAAFAVKEQYPDRVFFHAEIPMPEQPSVWVNKSDIKFWHYQVDNADYKSIYGNLSDFPESDRRKMSAQLLDDRNIGMVHHADILLAIYDGSKSGTGNAVKYAEKIGTETVLIDPKNYF